MQEVGFSLNSVYSFDLHRAGRAGYASVYKGGVEKQERAMRWGPDKLVMSGAIFCTL